MDVPFHMPQVGVLVGIGQVRAALWLQPRSDGQRARVQAAALSIERWQVLLGADNIFDVTAEDLAAIAAEWSPFGTPKRPPPKVVLWGAKNILYWLASISLERGAWFMIDAILNRGSVPKGERLDLILTKYFGGYFKFEIPPLTMGRSQVVDLIEARLFSKYPEVALFRPIGTRNPWPTLSPVVCRTAPLGGIVCGAISGHASVRNLLLQVPVGSVRFQALCATTQGIPPNHPWYWDTSTLCQLLGLAQSGLGSEKEWRRMLDEHARGTLVGHPTIINSADELAPLLASFTAAELTKLAAWDAFVSNGAAMIDLLKAVRTRFGDHLVIGQFEAPERYLLEMFMAQHRLNWDETVHRSRTDHDATWLVAHLESLTPKEVVAPVQPPVTVAPPAESEVPAASVTVELPGVRGWLTPLLAYAVSLAVAVTLLGVGNSDLTTNGAPPLSVMQIAQSLFSISWSDCGAVAAVTLIGGLLLNLVPHGRISRGFTRWLQSRDSGLSSYQ